VRRLVKRRTSGPAKLTVSSSLRFGFCSSPANGVWSTDPFAERWIAPNGDTSTSEYFGDQHYYNYVADSQNVATMMSPR